MKFAVMVSAMLALVGFALASTGPLPSATTLTTLKKPHIPVPMISTTPTPSTTLLAHVANRQDDSPGTAIGGALDSTHKVTVNVKAIPTPPPYVTIALINNAGHAITTTHGRNPGVPEPTGGMPAPGTLANGGRAQIVYPTGWAGRIAVNDAKYSGFRGDESLVEASFQIQPAVSPDFATFDINVSYVDGHTLPIVCTCASGGARLSGCDFKLWNQGGCPDDNGNGACRNPLRHDNLVMAAHSWFKPCEGLAYTFPMDIKANSDGACQSGLVECRVYSAR